MTNIGLPVPPGFIITTKTCLQYFDSSPELPFGLVEEVAQAVQAIEQQTGREFGNPSNPLLFSVRSGAAISMPGMMDTGAWRALGSVACGCGWVRVDVGFVLGVWSYAWLIDRFARLGMSRLKGRSTDCMLTYLTEPMTITHTQSCPWA